MAIYNGTNKIGSMFVGNNSIGKLFNGNDSVYSAGLPAGYIELKWIESTGTQWIDPDISFDDYKNGSYIETELEKTDSSQASSVSFFGVGGWLNYRNYLTSFEFGWGNGNGYTQNLNLQANEKLKIVCSTLYEKKLIVNDITILNTIQAAQTLTDSNAKYYILRNYHNESPLKARLYYFAYYSQYQSNKIRHLIPCINPSNEVGMYDLVSKTFYGNSGTGSFIAGPPKVTLPTGYTQLDYIQSDGNQYIITPTKLGSSSKVFYDFAGVSLGRWNANFGSFEPGTSTSYLIGTKRDGGTWYFIHAGASIDFSADWADRHRLLIDMPNRKLTVDTTEYSTVAVDAYTCNNNAVIVGAYDNGTYKSSSMKCHQCIIIDNSLLKHNFIPCTSPSNEVGMFDIVTQQFFGNSGTGTFIAGNPV